jgi:branched-chain amino acid transport system substrate-binding protein
LISPRARCVKGHAVHETGCAGSAARFVEGKLPMSRSRREALAGLAAVGLGLLGQDKAWAADTVARGQSEITPLRIGALFPATGPLASHGDECLRGVQLAVALSNQTGGIFGRPVTLVTGDAADADRAVSEARRLIAEGPPVLILGTGASALSLGATEVSEGSGVPYWELSAVSPGITTRGFRYLVRVCETQAGIADCALQAATRLLGADRAHPKAPLGIAVLYANDSNGTALAQLVTAAAHLAGLPAPEAIAYQADSADFSGIARRLQTLGPDVVLHQGDVEQVVLFYNALQTIRWKPRLVIGTSAAYQMSETAALVGAAFDGTVTIGVVPYRVGPQSAPQADAVAQAYAAAYGGPPRSGESLAHYAGTRLCFDTLARAGSPDRDKLIAAVKKTDLPLGALANGWGAAFGTGGQNTRAFACASQWQGGGPVALLPEATAAGRFDNSFRNVLGDLDKS